MLTGLASIGVGRVLRTQDGVREDFVSNGHRMDLDGACALALAARNRLPETTRAADLLSRETVRAALAVVPAGDPARDDPAGERSAGRGSGGDEGQAAGSP